jgi:hypothetical protein
LLDAFLVGDDPFAGQGNRKFFSGKDIYQMVQTEAVDFGLNPDHATSVNDPLPRRHSLAHWGGHFGIGGGMALGQRLPHSAWAIMESYGCSQLWSWAQPFSDHLTQQADSNRHRICRAVSSPKRNGFINGLKLKAVVPLQASEQRLPTGC